MGRDYKINAIRKSDSIEKSIKFRAALCLLAFVLAALSSLLEISALRAADEAPLMTIAGRISVNAQGAANYSIPIKVLKGTAGMQPIVSLDYSSSAGDGIVGVGWGLSIGFPSQPFGGSKLLAALPKNSPNKPVDPYGDPSTGIYFGSAQRLDQKQAPSSDNMLMIERCGRTVAQDGVHGGVNYDSNDRFCINGKRLILTSGTYGADGSVYRTEVDEFTKITANTSGSYGPDSFEVRTRKGQILQFGYTTGSTGSRHFAVGSSYVRVWALDKVTDPKGNYLTITYSNDSTNGQIYPTQIAYTGNSGASVSPYASVQFSYTTRNDIVPKYKAGSLQQTTVLLTNIKTYYGGTLVYDYQLAYRSGSSTYRSRLTSLTLCNASSICLPTMAFGWQGGPTSFDYMTQTSSVGSVDASISPVQTTIIAPGDFNGDGLTDLSGDCLSAGSYVARVFYGNSSSTFTSGTMTQNRSGSAVNWCYTASNQADSYYSETLGDINGDGYVDLVSLYTGGTGYDVFLNDKAGGFVYKTTVSTTNNSFALSGFEGFGPLFDFNGDGRADHFEGNTPWLSNYVSNGTGSFSSSGASIPHTFHYYTTHIGDFDGDGCSDVLDNAYDTGTSSNHHQIIYSCNPAVGTYTTTPTWQWNQTKQLLTADFNGDGLTDVLAITTVGNALYYSTGTTLVDSGYSVPSGIYNCVGDATLVSGDWNGDGRTDLACIWLSSVTSGGANDHTIWLSTGSGFSQVATITNNSSADVKTIGNENTITPVVADWNNDGTSDIWILKPSGSVEIFMGRSSGAPYAPELMTTISNGVGATTTIAYDRINKGTPFYTKGTNASHPTTDQIGPMYVVSQTDMPNVIGGSYTVTYKYEAALQDHNGRNFLGFSKIIATDSQTSVVTTTNYQTSFPYTGKISSQVKVRSGITLENLTNTFTATNSGVGPTFVSLSQKVEDRNDLNGAAYPSVTTSYTYDSYGNITQVQETVSGATRTITSNYTNDTTNWILGKLDDRTITSNVTGSAGTSLPSYSAYVGPSGNIWGSFNWGPPNNW